MSGHSVPCLVPKSSGERTVPYHPGKKRQNIPVVAEIPLSQRHSIAGNGAASVGKHTETVLMYSLAAIASLQYRPLVFSKSCPPVSESLFKKSFLLSLFFLCRQSLKFPDIPFLVYVRTPLRPVSDHSYSPGPDISILPQSTAYFQSEMAGGERPGAGLSRSPGQGRTQAYYGVKMNAFSWLFPCRFVDGNSVRKALLNNKP